MTSLYSRMPFGELVENVRQCRICEAQLPLGHLPVIQISQSARLLVVGQAPGRRVHDTGLPFNDPSGDRLRNWMGIEPGHFLRRTATGDLAHGVLLSRHRKER